MSRGLGDVYKRQELFGRKVSLPRGAARLAMRTGAPVLGVCCRRLDDGRSQLNMEILLAPGEAASAGENNTQQKIYSAIEGYIRDNADQWCIFRRFWEDTA